MGPRPYRPLVECEGALDRGELDFAITLAREVAEDQRRPIKLSLALRLLALVATRQTDSYDAWALRWLVRWIAETPGATIDVALDVAAGLAALPVEPQAIEAIRQTLA
jgi:hypothetical protein